ncbi:anti-sigma factor [Corynebacterium cystitidis]|uniref:anti-sigma factor n=1 Tax=Corynebacterium cystitidis TaxID=35757 RepID=UPI00211F3230|nr:anti-sigma factor [Corynebacterium cystitidis]
MSTQEHNEECCMDCGEAQSLLCELLDEDTTDARAEEIKWLISRCPECFEQLKSERAVRELVRGCSGCEPAPETLRSRIIARISVTYTEMRFQ